MKDKPEVCYLVFEQTLEPVLDASVHIFLFDSNGSNSIGSAMHLYLNSKFIDDCKSEAISEQSE